MKSKKSATAANPYTHKVALSFQRTIPEWKLSQGEEQPPIRLFHIPVTQAQAIKFSQKPSYCPIWFWDFIDENYFGSCDLRTFAESNESDFIDLERERVFCYGVEEN